MKSASTTLRISTVMIFVFAAGSLANADESASKPAGDATRYTPVTYCAKTATPPTLDGKLDDECWKSACTMTDFVRDDRDEFVSKPTAAMACWDKNFIYFAFRCTDDDMKSLVATKTGRCTPWEDDAIELFISPGPERKAYAQFVVNANGANNYPMPQSDLAYIAAAAVKGENEWIVEARVPIAVMSKAPVRAGDVWGLNIARNIPRPGAGQNGSWARLKGSYHMTDRFGLMVFCDSSPETQVKWIDIGPGYEGANVMLFSLTNSGVDKAMSISTSSQAKKNSANLAITRDAKLLFGVRYDLQANDNTVNLSVGDDAAKILGVDLRISARNRPANFHFNDSASTELIVSNPTVNQPEQIAASIARRTIGAAGKTGLPTIKYSLAMPKDYPQATLESADGKFDIPTGPDGEATLTAGIGDDPAKFDLSIPLTLAGAGLQAAEKKHQQMAARMAEIIAKTKNDPLLSLYCKKTQIKLEQLKSFCKDRQLAKASAVADEIAHHVDQLAAGQQPVWGHHELTYRSDIDDSDQPFFVSIPPTYDPSGSDKMPVMLWLHCWWGDAGWTAEDIKAYASAMELACWKKGVILVHPFGRGSNFYQFDAMKDVDDVMDLVEKKWRIDPDRIYIAGFSMGGYGALQLASARPEKFAAMAAFSYAVDSLSPENPAKITSLFSLPLENLFRTPVYLSCGAQEKVCAQMAKMADLIKKFPARTVDTKFFAAPNEGHSEDYIDFTSLLDWMLNLRRMPPPAVFSYTADDLIFNRGFWCSIDGLTNFAKPGKVSVSLANNKLTIETTGVASLSLTPPATLYDNSKPLEIFLNQTRINAAPDNNGVIHIAASPASSPTTTPTLPPKRPGLSGPMGLAIASGPIVLIACDDDSQQAAQSVAAEWQNWHHGKMSVVRQADITDADLAGKNLILVGNWNGDGLMARMQQSASAVKITNKGAWISERKINFGGVGVAFIHPSPVDPTKLALVLTGVNTKTVAGAAEIFQRRRFDTDFYSGIEGGFFDVNWK